MNNLNINKLIDKRIDVLKAEIGVLLFNLGKTHIGFWEEKGEGASKVQYFSVDKIWFEKEFGYSVFGEYRNYYERKNGVIPFDVDLKWDKLKDFIYKTKINLDLFGIKEIPLYNLIYGDALPLSDQSILNRIFFRGCENANSGIDKSAPKKQCKNLWISNAFGSFNQAISFNGNVEKVCFDEKRLSLLMRLNNELSQYDNNPDNLTDDNWVEIRRFVLKGIKEWYSHLLSDSRFPVNDVTLWDQAYMTASLFKASIAAMLLDEKMCEVYEMPKNIRWSILGIQYDKLSLINKSLKAHFISWYNESINICDEEIKRIIEEKYVLGNEIYRDETGIYFIVPENILSDTKKELSCLHENMYIVEKDILAVFRRVFTDEIYPSIFVTKPSRGTMNLAYLIEKSEENFLRPSLPKEFGEDILKTCKNSNYNGICQVCGVRPGLIDKNDEDNMILCRQCSSRKESRMMKWFENQENETIWTGELQDKNGRIALITLKFELRNWLNGDLLNSLVINDEDYGSYKYYLEKIKNLMINMQSVYKRFISGGDKNLLKFCEFSTNNIENKNNEDNIKAFLSLFEKKGIEKPYYNVLSKIINILFNNNLKEDNIRLKELFCNEFFDFLKKNWHCINEKNKDDIHFIIFNKNREFVCNLETREIEKDRFKDYYRISLLKDIFSFAYIETQIKGVLLERSIGDRWETYIREKLGSKINFEKREIQWDELNSEDIDFLTNILLQFLLRKNPSPARLRRISETTKGFFEDIQKDLVNFMYEDKDYEYKKEWRSKRIVWHVDNLKDYQKNREYEYKELEFMTDGFGNVYLISSIEKAIEIISNAVTGEEKVEKTNTNIKVDILEAIRSDDFSWIKDSLFIEPAQKNSKHNGEDKIIELRKENSIYKKYLPYISVIDPTSTMWQFIVPSECITQVVRTVKNRYNQHFKYVIGKLPLHIGVIIQDYKKPLYVGLKALRNIKRDIDDIDTIKKEVSATELNSLRKEGIDCENEHEKLEPLKDVYSLYEVKNNQGKNIYGRYKFCINPDKKEDVWINIPECKTGSEMYYIYPNTFDFEFLDVNTRRNDIFYGENGKRTITKKNRPYTWAEWILFEKFLECFNKENYKTKLQNIISLMYSKMEEWGSDTEQLKNFIASSFINILNLKNNKDELDEFAKIFGEKNWDDLIANTPPEEFKEKLIMFIDMYEFWHKVLKKL